VNPRPYDPGLRLRRPGWLRRSPPVLSPPPNRRTGPSRSERWREVVRLISRHRRWVSAGFLGIGVAITVSTLAPRPTPGEYVVTAARDLQPGASLTASDLRQVRFSTAQLPAGAITRPGTAIGHRLGSAMRRGEPLTDVRLDDAGTLASPGHGLVATPIRLADTRAAQLLQPGMRIDVLAASSSSTLDSVGAGVAPATVVASDVTVVAVPTSSASGPSANAIDPLDQDGALVVLATTPAQARVLAQAQVSDRLSAVSLG
jgi:pilus assembly protein CpaB